MKYVFPGGGENRGVCGQRGATGWHKGVWQGRAKPHPVKKKVLSWGHSDEGHCVPGHAPLPCPGVPGVGARIRQLRDRAAASRGENRSGGGCFPAALA